MMQPGLLQRLARKLDKTLASLLYVDQWVILTARGLDFASLRWDAFTPLFPDKDRYWGDPFILQKNGHYFAFVEEKLYGTGRGRIACLELDPAGGLLGRQVVLEREYHLSYPFVFEHAHEIFMLPESAANRTLELYRCVNFPNTWEPAGVLLRDVYAVDATLLEHAGRTWLFANIKEDGGSSLNALHLYWANDPLSQTWNAHPGNPVVRDIASARPAGRIFVHEGRLIRPSQDSRLRYGHSLRFNQITCLNEEQYSEELVASFKPSGGAIRATHTFNQIGDLTVIDAVIRRPK